MQVQRVQNNYNTSFGEKLVFDTKLITRATREEKYELALLKRLFRDNGQKGNIKIKNDKKISVKEVIENLKSKFAEIETENAKSRIIEDAFGNK